MAGNLSRHPDPNADGEKGGGPVKEFEEGENPAGSHGMEGIADASDAAYAAARDELLRRLKTIKGHIAGIEKMVEHGQDCTDVLAQLAAIKSAINKVQLSVLESYARQCVLNSMASGRDVQAEMQRMIDTIFKTLR
ncbi:MAG: metal-sensitive transcriptional regulator [Firmicutes bacterium]|nr:metal-sensitive transcriptional regulator [Bacillota bacterium]